MPVQQWPAGVSGIDGGIGLDGFVDGGAVRLLHGTDGTDDAAGHGAREAEGIADGVDLLAHLQIAGIAQDGRCEVWAR